MGIRFENVNFIYGIGSGYEKQALKNVSFSIEEGEFVGLVGHTGSGKSTLIHLMNGLEKPTSGTVYYNGIDIHGQETDRGTFLKQLRSKVGVVFQYPENQLFEISVIEDVKFGPKNLGLSNLEVEKRSFDALRLVGIEDDLLDVSPHTLSGGQKRRVAIAGVLAMEPDVLILDEPTAGLDPAGRDEMFALLKKLRQERGTTIVLVSHSMDDVAKYADRILVMNQGELVLDGTPRQVFAYEEELCRIGLGVPEATRVLHLLKEAGADLEDDGITPEEAAERIASWIKK